jgi:hypothetical protein
VTDDRIDRTAELLDTHPEHLADNAVVVLTSAQLDVLKRFLEDVRAVDPGLNFMIERWKKFRNVFKRKRDEEL